MNETVIYNVWHENAYGTLILFYFFLGGMSGGSFIISALARIFGNEKYKSITIIGAVASIILIGLGGVCLFLDLGRQMRVLYLITHFNITSPVSWGSLIIGIFSICNLIFLYSLLISKNDKMADLFAKIGIVFAGSLTAYTGFLLSMGKARPLWHSAIMPPLFLVSGCISGLALIILIANILKLYPAEDSIMQKLGKILIALILVDIFFLNDMYVLYIGISEAHEIAKLLLIGKFAFLFWGIELLLGSILPIIILFKKKLSPSRGWQVTAAVCSLVGVFSMRYIIIIIGQHFPLS